MILRVPDYYDEFTCIADRCEDSCCIGWEINIYEDTYAFYNHTDGEIGQRLKENMYLAEDGEYSFRLKAHGRCPFLNGKNLRDLCIVLGEVALSDVCTVCRGGVPVWRLVKQISPDLNCKIERVAVK